MEEWIIPNAGNRYLRHLYVLAEKANSCIVAVESQVYNTTRPEGSEHP
jgi:hypothetical protein